MQRKVFRVEQMFAERRKVTSSARDAIDQHKTFNELRRGDTCDDALRRELASVQEAIAHNKRELASLIGQNKDRRMPRAAGELGAAIAGMEKATQKILHEAEAIDECARALAATAKSDYERGLAQDIQDHTVQVYEACNFQDLAGQRIAKVIDMLNAVDEQLATMLARCNGHAGAKPVRSTNGGGLINGPRLDGDVGHANQRDIDAMFG